VLRVNGDEGVEVPRVLETIDRVHIGELLIFGVERKDRVGIAIVVSAGEFAIEAVVVVLPRRAIETVNGRWGSFRCREDDRKYERQRRQQEQETKRRYASHLSFFLL